MHTPSRSHAVALLAILLVAFAVRVYALDAQSLWYDEAVTAQVTQQGLSALAQWTADDIQPPLYYATVAGWTRLAGTSEWALRFPSVAFGLAMVALAYALGKRLFGQPAAWLAAFLAGIHPLWVYYSQEARMYTLLTALGMLAGYALLRVLAAASGAPRRRWRWWAVFAGASVALLYTHYFAAFLLLAYALVFLLALALPAALSAPLARPARRRLLAEGAGIALLAVLVYLPWLPNAVRRFGVDASYWQGTLKLDEAIRHIAISFTTGETVLEHQAIPLAWAIVLLAGVCWVALVWQAVGDRKSEVRRQRSEGRGQRTEATNQRPEPETPQESHNLALPQFRNPAIPLALLFVTLTLLVPIVAILMLSYRTPKFNPRYLMLASPALVLLLAGGLALPFTRGLRAASGTPLRARIARIASAFALVAASTIFLLADRNWFADPAFTKDDWRGAVAFVRAHLAPDERVVLVSGHALPAWRYYAPDVEPLRLPELEILDVNAVLDWNGAASALEQGLGGTHGAWLLQWQNGVVDPTAVVPYLMKTAGDQQPVDASFWGLGSPQHYRWPKGTSFRTLAEQPFDSEHRGQALGVNFGNQVELAGSTQPACDQADCPVYLFWRALQPLQADYKLAAALVGRQDDVTWSSPADRRLAGYEYPTFRWQPGALIVSQLPLDATPGTPPGAYRLRLSVYDEATGQALDVLDAAGAPQGRWAWLDPVAVDRAVPGSGAETPASGAKTLAAPGVLLDSLAVSAHQIMPGDRFLVDAWWLLEEPQNTVYGLRAEWLDPSGQPSPEASCEVIDMREWPAGAPLRSQIVWNAPQELAPGAWQLHFGLVAGGCAGDASTLGGTEIVAMDVLPSNRRFEPSAAVQYPAHAGFGGLVTLLGLTVDDQSGQAAPARPGSSVPVTVTWQAMQPMATAYTGFVHLVDAHGTIVAQDDHEPRLGEAPTTRWVTGEVVEDRYLVHLPDDLPPGLYQFEIGLYDAGQPGLPRLRTSDGRDSIVIGPLVVGS